MPVYQWEQHVSRDFDVSGRNVGVTLHWFVTGTMDETEAFQSVLLATPLVYDNLVREGVSGNMIGGGNWMVEIKYSNIDPQHVLPNDGGPGGTGTTPSANGPSSDAEELPSSYAWDTTGATDKRMVSFRTMERKSASGAPGASNDKTRAQAALAGYMLVNQRAIGASAQGVSGADVFVPKFEWSREVKRTSVNKAYLRTNRNMVGKVNNAEFYRWHEGEVLYLGANGRQVNGRWEITHKFSVSENRFDVEIGNGITLEKVKGWEFVTVSYAAKVVGGLLLNLPQTATVEEVYEAKDFSLLEIGV